MRHLKAYLGVFLIGLMLLLPSVFAWTSLEFVSDETKSLDSLIKYGIIKRFLV